MKTGLAKQFKQVLDSQLKRAQSQPASHPAAPQTLTAERNAGANAGMRRLTEPPPNPSSPSDGRGRGATEQPQSAVRERAAQGANEGIGRLAASVSSW